MEARASSRGEEFRLEASSLRFAADSRCRWAPPRPIQTCCCSRLRDDFLPPAAKDATEDASGRASMAKAVLLLMRAERKRAA